MCVDFFSNRYSLNLSLYHSLLQMQNDSADYEDLFCEIQNQFANNENTVEIYK